MSILKAFNLFGQKGYWQLARGFQNGMKLSMSKEAIGEKLSVITTFNPGNFASKNKFTRALFNTMGKGVALSKVDGFGAYMAAASVGSAALGTGIGYLLGNYSDDNQQGLILEKENKTEEQKTPVQTKKPTTTTKIPVATVTKSKEKNYHQISTEGLSWASIVSAYYPELVTNHNGELYGEKGAIRALKTALSKDNNQLDLINATDIPKTLNLPMEINGIQINEKAEPHKVKIVNGGHTDITEAGKRDSIDVYTVTDKRNNSTYTNTNLNDALDSLKKKNNTEKYKVEYTK